MQPQAISFLIVEGKMKFPCLILVLGFLVFTGFSVTLIFLILFVLLHESV